MDYMTSQKKALREALKRKRAAISPVDQNNTASKLMEHAHSFLAGRNTQVISFYSPKGTELDPRPLAQELSGLGHSLCLPVVEPNSKIMIFRAYRFGDSLKKGAYDILEPTSDKLVVSPDIVLCPLLAVDMSGNRLGYGGGYFDQTLRYLRERGEVLAVGLAYDVQIIDEVPVDENDTGLDYVLSEKRCVQV